MSRETLSSGAKFLKFGEGEGKIKEFSGTFTGLEIKAEQDNEKEGRKAGDLMGYEFVDDKGELHLVGATDAIQKSMQKCSKGDKIYFTWIEKIEQGNGRSFNRFKIEREVITQA